MKCCATAASFRPHSFRRAARAAAALAAIWSLVARRAFVALRALVSQRALSALRALVVLAAIGEPSAHGAEIDFARDVAPLLQSRCVSCHQPGNAKGELSLATADAALEMGYIVPGDAQGSHLVAVLVAAEGERPLMPKKGDPLTVDEVALLRTWIDAGATWPEGYVIREASKADRQWWSLRPIVREEPPPVAGLPETWQVHPIDRFVGGRLVEAGLAPNERADRRALVRRLTFDLTGLPPTPLEVAAFLSDESDHAYERLVDRLLASPHYGEQWGRHWLDVVRFGESNGFERNVLIGNLWPFRDYVIRSLNDDKPFDQFICEHLAGDLIDGGNPAVAVGTAFLVCGPYDNVGNEDAAQAAVIRANTIDEMLRATSEAFLGMTLGCARCHDHKFDPLLQRDYYAMYATLAGVRHGERVLTSEAEAADRRARLAPWEDQREQIDLAREQLRRQILARAEQNAADLEAAWTRAPADRYGTEETFAPVEARFVRLVVEGLDTNPAANSGYRIDEFEIWTVDEPARNVALASAGATAHGAAREAEDFAGAYGARLAIDGQYGASWLAAGPELTIELGAPAIVRRVVFSSDRSQALDPRHPQTTFVSAYRIEVSSDGDAWTTVASGADRRPATPAIREHRLLVAAIRPDEAAQFGRLEERRAEVEREIAAVESPPTWWAGQFHEAGGPFHVFVGGDPQRLGDEVLPSSWLVLDDLAVDYQLESAAGEGERRRALADWITAEEHPLTARVLANRLWHYHFGTGIVDTPSDLGYMGGRPTHPELLDWLASELIAGGWRLKPLHKAIVMSEAYRQSSRYRADAAAADAQSRLLWRFPPRRLTGEEVRDAMLAVAGKLDPTMGGPGFRLYRYLEDNVATYVPLDAPGEETYRRAVYHQNARAARVDLMSDFDCPDPAFATPRRASTTTPLQALALLYHPFSVDMSRAMAERIAREAGPDVRQQVEAAFELVYARPATPDERVAAGALVEQHGLAALCRAVLNSNEFLYLP